MPQKSQKILSDDEVAAYHRDGYIVPKYRLDPQTLAKFQALMNKLVAENPNLLDQPIASVHIPDSGAQGLKTTREWIDIATHSDLMDMAEQVMGPDIILWGSTVFYKRALKGPVTHWHRDGAYWPIRPLATTSIWIAATNTFIENGCLKIIPGTHRARELGSHVRLEGVASVFPQALAEDQYDESQAKYIELEAGQMVMFDVYTIHGAGPNLGTAPRAGYSLRLMPATSYFDHDGGDPKHTSETPGAAYSTRPLLLVRGADRTGRNDFKRGHPQYRDKEMSHAST